MGETIGNLNEVTMDLIKAAKRMQPNRIRRILSTLSSIEENRNSETLENNVPLGLGLGVQKSDNFSELKKPTETFGVNGTDENGRSALHFSSGMSSSECTITLLQAGANPNLKDKEGFTPLHLAAGYGRSSCVEHLIKYGANPFIKDKLGHTPRELSEEISNGNSNPYDSVTVSKGNMDTVISLLANAEWKYHILAKEKDNVVAKQKKNPNSSINSKSIYEEIVTAATSGDYDLLKSHLDKMDCKLLNPLKVSALGNALSAACRAGHSKIVELLLNNESPVNNNDYDGATPLLAAADSGHSECVQILIRAGADANAKDRVGVTAMIAAAYNGHDECLNVLIENGAEVDAHSHGGVTPLIAAAEGKHANCIRILLKGGADINAKTTEGKTPLMHALGRDGHDATIALIEAGCDLNAVDIDGLTAMHHGAKNNSGTSLQILCERGGDVTRRCKKGRTAIMDAPKGSTSLSILETHWSVLEKKISQRQAELLQFLEKKDASHSPTPNSKGKEKKRAKKRRNDAKKHAEQSKLTTDESNDAKNDHSSSDSNVDTPVSQSYYHDLDAGKVFSSENDNERCDSSVCSSSVHSTEMLHDKQEGEEEEGEGERDDDDSVWIKIEAKKNSNAGIPNHYSANESSASFHHSVNSLSKKSREKTRANDVMKKDNGVYKRKDSGNKQPRQQRKKKEEDMVLEEEIQINNSAWVKVVKTSSETNARNKSKELKLSNSIHSTPISPTIVKNNSKNESWKEKFESSKPSSQLTNSRVGMEDVTGGERRKDTMDRHLSGDVALLYCRVKGLEEEMENKDKDVQREKYRAQDLEKDLRMEMETKEKVLKERKELMDALEAQRVARMEMEKEKRELERRVIEYQRMLIKSENREDDLTVTIAKLNLKLASLEEENREMRKKKQKEESMATAVVAMAASWQVMNLQNKCQPGSNNTNNTTNESRRVEELKALQSAYLNEYHHNVKSSSPSMPSSITSMASMPSSTLSSCELSPELVLSPFEFERVMSNTNSIQTTTTAMDSSSFDHPTPLIPCSIPSFPSHPSISNTIQTKASLHLHHNNSDFNSPAIASTQPNSPHEIINYNQMSNRDAGFNNHSNLNRFMAAASMECAQNDAYLLNHMKQDTSLNRSFNKPPLMKNSNHQSIRSFRKNDSVPDFRMFAESVSTFTNDSNSNSNSNNNSNVMGLNSPRFNTKPFSSFPTFHENENENEHVFEPLYGSNVTRSTLTRSASTRNGMTRSASEGCLHLMGGLQTGSAVLPFETSKDLHHGMLNGGWFSLVPSPLETRANNNNIKKRF